MSDSIARLSIDLEANIARFESGMNRAEALVNSTMGNIQRVTTMAMGLASKAVVGFAGYFAYDKFKSGIEGAIKSAAEMDKFAAKSGASVESLSGMGLAAKSAGVDMETVTASLAKLSKVEVDAATGGEKTSAIFKALGVSVRDADGSIRDSGKVMFDVAKGMDNITSGTLKAAVAQELFGKSGATLIPMLNKLAEQEELQGKLTAEQAYEARKLLEVQKKLDARNTLKLQPFSNAVVPAWRDFNDAMAKGETLMMAINKQIEKWGKDGTFADIANDIVDLSATIIDAFQKASRYVAGTMDLMVTTWRYKNSPSDEFVAALVDVNKRAAARESQTLFSEDIAKSRADRAAGRKNKQKGETDTDALLQAALGKGDSAATAAKDKMSEWERYLTGLNEQTTKLELGEYAAMEAHARRIAEWNNKQPNLPKANLSDATDLIKRIQGEKLGKSELDYADALQKETDALYDQIGAMELSGLALSKFNLEKKEQQRLGDAIRAAEKSGLIATESAANTYGGQLKTQRDEYINQLTSTTARATQVQLEAIEYRYNRERELSSGAQKALQEYADAATNKAANISSVISGTFNKMEDALVDFVKTGKMDFKSLSDFIITEMIRIQIKQNITGPLAQMGNALFSGAGKSMGDWASGLFKASGGPVSGGHPYIVGEEGPEWFVPSSSGTILPNGSAPVVQQAAASPIVVNFTVNALDARSVQATLRQHASTIVGIFNQAANSTGRMGIAQG
ncbi:phage tail tape measure C-terminal domain-containing protein [Candidatus Magnetaquicoccus inordinatus]|uniref:phage tail tape measure C-terminal domain-containing protein n=1 Tax=Candidatus Magnetaquicoccus inordinatus TaxID=2496818 RepID=UPI00102C1155|nr:phage tail tape measure C-terminal domain-containing protein [Candidatus Magnetaquicoccus inordinatus]